MQIKTLQKYVKNCLSGSSLTKTKVRIENHYVIVDGFVSTTSLQKLMKLDETKNVIMFLSSHGYLVLERY